MARRHWMYTQQAQTAIGHKHFAVKQWVHCSKVGRETWVTDQTPSNSDYCWNTELFVTYLYVSLTAAVMLTIVLTKNMSALCLFFFLSNWKLNAWRLPASVCLCVPQSPVRLQGRRPPSHLQPLHQTSLLYLWLCEYLLDWFHFIMVWNLF